MCSISESSCGPGSTLSIREAERYGARSLKAGIVPNRSRMLIGAGTRLGRYSSSDVLSSACLGGVKLAEAVKLTAGFGKRVRGRFMIASNSQMANMVGSFEPDDSSLPLTAMNGSLSFLM